MQRLIAVTTIIVLAGGQAGAQLGADAAAQAARLDRDTHARATAALRADPNLARNPLAVLLKFQPGASNAMRNAARAAAGAATMRNYTLVPGLELVQTNLAPEAAVAMLRSMPGVAYAELDYVVGASEDPPRIVPNDALFWYQWGFDNSGQTGSGTPGTPGADINAPEAWWVATGDPAFVIGVVDTGIQYSHADLAANMWINIAEVPANGIDDDGNGYIDDVRGWDFYSQDNDPMDETGHGTHVAGTIGAGANNGIGVAGVMWECRLMPLRFLGPEGTGLISDAVLALEYATAKGVKVTNHRWGGAYRSQSLYDAIDASRSIGHIVVASAGNDGRNIDKFAWSRYPAAFDLDNIISVAATDRFDAIAPFSNFGATAVDLGAPGVIILSSALTTLWGPGPCPFGIYTYYSGTSMAAPHVTGVVGLVYAQNPEWTYQQVRAQVINTARPVASLAGKTVSGGVVDAATAVGVSMPGPATPPAAPGPPALTALGGSAVGVSWIDHSTNEDGFRIERETKQGPKWKSATIIATVPADTTSTTDAPAPARSATARRPSALQRATRAGAPGPRSVTDDPLSSVSVADCAPTRARFGACTRAVEGAGRKLCPYRCARRPSRRPRPSRRFAICRARNPSVIRGARSARIVRVRSPGRVHTSGRGRCRQRTTARATRSGGCSRVSGVVPVMSRSLDRCFSTSNSSVRVPAG
jgi:subtilisin family serine protease